MKTQLVNKMKKKHQASQPPALENEPRKKRLPSRLSSIAVCAMRSALRRQCAVRHTKVEREACRHLSILDCDAAGQDPWEGRRIETRSYGSGVCPPTSSAAASKIKRRRNCRSIFCWNQLKTQSSSKASGCRSATLRNSQSKSAAAGP